MSKHSYVKAPTQGGADGGTPGGTDIGCRLLLDTFTLTPGVPNYPNTLLNPGAPDYYDTDGMYSASTPDRILINTSGKYLVWWNFTLGTVDAPTFFWVNIEHNVPAPNVAFGYYRQEVAASYNNQGMMVEMILQAGDYIRFDTILEAAGIPVTVSGFVGARKVA